MLRNIVRIDEAKCNGCGLCVTACAEGAIRIIDGKARLVKDQYCDGLGACLGECPQAAITIEQREAEAFDEVAVQRHLAVQGEYADKETRRHGDTEQQQGTPARGMAADNAAMAPGGPAVHGSPVSHASHGTPANGAGVAPGTPARGAGAAPRGCPGAAAMSLGGGCPGSAARALGGAAAAAGEAGDSTAPSALGNWPVQLRLVSPMAPYLDGARLCIAADCTAFAHGGFHRDMLAGKVLLIGCPKLDDVAGYIEKVGAILGHNAIRSIEVVYMEVPCCFGLVHLVRQAIAASGKAIPLTLTKVGIEGGVVERTEA